MVDSQPPFGLALDELAVGVGALAEEVAGPATSGVGGGGSVRMSVRLTKILGIGATESPRP